MAPAEYISIFLDSHMQQMAKTNHHVSDPELCRNLWHLHCELSVIKDGLIAECLDKSIEHINDVMLNIRASVIHRYITGGIELWEFEVKKGALDILDMGIRRYESEISQQEDQH